MSLSAPQGVVQVFQGDATTLTGTFTFDSRRKRQLVFMFLHDEYASAPTIALTISKQGGGAPFTPTLCSGSPTISGSANIERIGVYALNDADIYAIVGGFGVYTATVSVTYTGGSSPRGHTLYMGYVTDAAQTAPVAYGNSGATGTAFTAGSVPATAGCLVISAVTANSGSTITNGSGYTEIYDVSSGNNRAQCQYAFKSSTVTPDCATTGSTNSWAMTAILIAPFTDLSQVTADDTSPNFQQTITLTVSGLPSDVQTNVYFDFNPQTIVDWNVSGGAGTITVTYSVRTDQPCGTLLDVYINRHDGLYDLASTNYLLPGPSIGYDPYVDVGAVVETDPSAGLASHFPATLVTGDQIAVQSSVGGTITVGPDTTVTAGPGYVAGAAIGAEAYDASTGLWSSLQFAINDSGLADVGNFGLLRHRQAREARAGRVVAFSRRGGAR